MTSTEILDIHITDLFILTLNRLVLEICDKNSIIFHYVLYVIASKFTNVNRTFMFFDCFLIVIEKTLYMINLIFTATFFTETKNCFQPYFGQKNN